MIIKSRIFRKFCVSYHKEANSLTSVNPKLYCFLGSFLTIFEIWQDIRRICLNSPFLLIPHKKIDTTHYKKNDFIFKIFSYTLRLISYVLIFSPCLEFFSANHWHTVIIKAQNWNKTSLTQQIVSKNKKLCYRRNMSGN